MPIYSALGVPEVWRVYEGVVQILVLRDGDYGMVDQSIALPLMTTAILQGFLDQAPLMGETSWAKMVQQWVRGSV